MVLPRNKPKTKWYRTVKNKCLKKKQNWDLSGKHRKSQDKKNFISDCTKFKALHGTKSFILQWSIISSADVTRLWGPGRHITYLMSNEGTHRGPFERMVHCGVTEGDRQNNSRSQGLRKAWTPVRCVIKPPLTVRIEIAEWRRGDQHWSSSCTNQMFHSPYCGLNISPKSS